MNTSRVFWFVNDHVKLSLFSQFTLATIQEFGGNILNWLSELLLPLMTENLG